MTDDPKPKKNRSPNYPAIDLEAAVEKSRLLFTKYGTVPAPKSNACLTMGYKTVNATSDQGLAALKAYGLIDAIGVSESQKIAVSEVGARIIRNAPDKKSLLQQAALAPSIHKAVVAQYNGVLPHNDILRQYLVWDRPAGSRFNEDVVDTFIKRLRHTLAYAEVELNSETPDEQTGRLVDSPENSAEPKVSRREIKVGSSVQWTSDGVDQFEEPTKVIAISEDKNWAFVEDSETGVPVNQLTVFDQLLPESDDSTIAKPPINPFFKKSKQNNNNIEEQKNGFANERKQLDEGHAEISWPDNLTKESFEEFEYWLMGVIKRARRKAGLPLKA